MGYFQILSCSSELGTCCDNPALIYILDATRRIFNLIQIIAPILLILMGTIEFARLVMNPELKNGTKRIKNLFIAAVIIFFLPMLVDAVLGIMPQSFSVSSCWEKAKISAEANRKSEFQYSPLSDDEAEQRISIINGSKWEPSPDGGGSSSGGTLSAKGILDGAEKVHTKYEQEKWYYYTDPKGGSGSLIWNNIKASTYNSSKKTCCATFVGSAFYVGGVFSEEELNKYNYNSQLGISDLCQAHGWKKITSYSALAAGDIVIMSDSHGGHSPAHVQIYAGNGTWYNAGWTDSIQRENPYASDASARFLYAWRKP